MREARRVQYARNYLELFDLFERNGIDVWLTDDAIHDEIDMAGIEWPNRYVPGGFGFYALVVALRNADMVGNDRMQAVIALEAERRDRAGEPKLAATNRGSSVVEAHGTTDLPAHVDATNVQAVQQYLTSANGDAI